MPIHRNGNKFEFNTVISGINKYYFRHDDIERPTHIFIIIYHVSLMTLSNNIKKIMKTWMICQ